MNKFKKAFINGKIFTVNPKQEWVEAVVTAGNKIIYVGSSDGAKKYIDDFTEVIDLNGKLMLPGFIDCHAHIVMGGEFLLNVNLTDVVTINEFKERIKNFALNNPNKWMIGGNWNHQLWKDAELPKKEWIDQFTKDTPVFVSRMDYHMVLANSYVLNLAGITKNTPDPAGGTIIKDPVTGEPTGILKDKAMDLVYRIIPKPTDKEFAEAIDAAMNEARRFGVTSIHDISYKNHLGALQNAERENRLTCRVYSRLLLENYKDFINSEIQFNFGNDKLKIGSLKAFADGSLGSSTAYFFESYEDDLNNYGLPMDVLSDGRLEKWMVESDKNKLQLSIHAIGDRAISELLDIVENMNRENPDWDRRFRLEHAQHITESDIRRSADLGVIVSAQPYHLYDDGCWAEKKIGKERLKNMLAFKSLLNNGVNLCFGSDWSVSTMNPIEGIYAAVTRQTADGKNPNGLIPEEKLTVEEAVQCYTINAAYASFQEEKVGSIEPGKFADLVILSDNIFEIDPPKIRDVKVITTVFDGELIYTIN